MLKKIGLLFVLLMVSCSHQSLREKDTVQTHSIDKLSIKELDVFNLIGQVKFIEFEEDRGTILTCGEDSIPFTRKEGKVYFFWGESYFSQRKIRTCFLKDKDHVYVKINIHIGVKDYPSEFLKVAGRRVLLSQKDLQRVQRERKALKYIYAKGSLKPLFNSSFTRPLKSKITSHYGKKRVFNGVRKSQHLGVDFRGGIGTPIPSSNKGIVIFVGDLFYSGKTVIIDHGMGLFTTYGHLNSTQAKVGEAVEKGDIIGRVGMTGRVTGPHLHWGVKLHGNWVDGMSLEQETLNLLW